MLFRSRSGEWLVHNACGGAGPVRIGKQAVQDLEDKLPGFAQEQHWDSSVGRRYDGKLAGQSVEVKTSVNGTVRMSPFHASQIARDALNLEKPLWVFYNANPSAGMLRALKWARMPWAVVWP